MSRRTVTGLSAAIICLYLLGLFLFVGQAHAQSSTGTVWQGKYYFAKGDERLPVPFTLQLRIDGTSISGRTTEPATFGNGASSYLYANISGTLSGSNISFTKTYDGTAGVSHPVECRGLVSADGARMSGTWGIGNSSGTFSATKAGQ